MKKVLLILVFALFSLSNLDLKAQYHHIPPPDPSQYDLLYVFDTSFFIDCFMISDTNKTWFRTQGYSMPYSRMFQEWCFYGPYNKLWCNPTAPLIDGYVIGANSYNAGQQTYAEAFAQDYYLDETNIPYNDYVVCGVAMKIGLSSIDTWRNICILDDNFDTISSTIFHTFNVGPSLDSIVNWNRDGWNTYYFPERDYARLTNINGFKIAFDVPKFGSNYFYMYHTCNVYSPCLRDSIFAHGGPYECGLCYDTIYAGMVPSIQLYYNLKDSLTGQWYSEDFHPTDHPNMWWFVEEYFDMLKDYTPEDNIPLCSFPDEKYIRHNDQWVRFADDPAYTIWQNIYIAMVPIIMIPSNTQSLPEVELEKMCYLFPNPTKDYFKVMSHYTINSIQVYDIVGKLILERNVNNFDAGFDVSGFSSGSYIVKINTVKGEVKKKLIIE